MSQYAQKNSVLIVFAALFLCAAAPVSAGPGAVLSTPDPVFSAALARPVVPGDIPLPAARPEQPAFPLVYARSSGKITVGINPNRELMYTLLHLTRYSEKLRGSSEQPIAAEVRKEFAPFAGHPAVAELDYGGRLNWQAGLGYDAFSSLPGYFSALPEGRRLYPYDQDFLDRVLYGMTDEEKTSYLDAYWQKAMDFYRTSGFAAFFERKAPVYRAYVDSVYAGLPGADPVGLHEEYHANRSFQNFYVVPSPLSLPTGGNYGWRIGGYIFNFMGDGFDDKEDINYLILHEFGHSFCNPVVEKYEAELSAYEGLYAGVAAEMKKQAYGNWLTVMRETLVRAVHARLVLRTEGPEAAELFLLDNSFRRKFVFIQDFYALLAEYEADRGRYPTLYEFYPRLAASLGGWDLAEVEEAGDPGVWSSPAGEGLYIGGLSSSGYAYAAGLRWGDTVTSADGARPAADFFYKLVPGHAYALSVTRQDGSRADLSFAVPSQRKLRPVKKTAALKK
ncbi:MAG: DUF4932 domain-containing protein [Elusimicrobiales bacterium]